MEDYIEIFNSEVEDLKKNLNVALQEISIIKKDSFDFIKELTVKDLKSKKSLNYCNLCCIKSLANEQKSKTHQVLRLVNKLKQEALLILNNKSD